MGELRDQFWELPLEALNRAEWEALLGRFTGNTHEEVPCWIDQRTATNKSVGVVKEDEILQGLVIRLSPF